VRRSAQLAKVQPLAQYWRIEGQPVAPETGKRWTEPPGYPIRLCMATRANEWRNTVITVRQNELSALLSLLDDDNDIVQDRVSKRLRELGANVVPAIEHEMAETSGFARERARAILTRIRQDGIVDRFAEIAAEPEFDLEMGAFLLAETRFPDLDPEGYRAWLDEKAAQVRAEIPADLPADQAVGRLARVLFGDDGLKGNSEVYYDPDNSYINRVIDRKLGIPILLSVIALLVGRRAGLNVAGIGMPGHFLAALTRDSQRVLFDPFHDGRITTEEECRARLDEAGVQWKESYLDPLPNRLTMFRMLVNLILIYQHSGDTGQVELLGTLATVIQHGNTPEDR
jgi:regulator of sirC expression with transglutaminase-like and TPR domain